jgi:hypothetical protein
MTNTKLVENMGDEVVSINAREEYESDEHGKIVVGRVLREPVFIYDKETGKKL